MNKVVSQESPILFPPKDSELRKRLEIKLLEYEERKRGKGMPWEYWHPEQAHMVSKPYRDACYKAEVLKAVLSSTQDKPVKTFDLCQQMAENYGPSFDGECFNNACSVISNYLGQTSCECEGGTGLPDITIIKSQP